MLKWVLGAIALMVGVIAVFIGVVWFLFTREGPDLGNYTDLQSAEVIELQDTGSAYTVIYKYTYGGQVFYGRTSIQSRSMSVGSEIGICVNPESPAQHAHTRTDCAENGPSNPEEGLKEKPSL